MFYDPFAEAYATEFQEEPWTSDDELFMAAQEAREAQELAENGPAEEYA